MRVGRVYSLNASKISLEINVNISWLTLTAMGKGLIGKLVESWKVSSIKGKTKTSHKGKRKPSRTELGKKR